MQEKNWKLRLPPSHRLSKGERRRKVGYTGAVTFNGVPGVPQPPSQGHIRDASRRVRISSQPDIREAAGVCARWAGPDPTWAQADRDRTTNVASRGYSAWSNPESSCRWRSLIGIKKSRHSRR